MARINIEESIFKDQRFIKLCIELGSLDLALGCLVRAWALAQKWYLTPDKKIPHEEWKKQSLPDQLISTGLAEVVDGKIWLKGADEQFAWLKQRSEAGRRNIEKFNERPLTADDGRTSSLLSSPSSLLITHNSFSDLTTKATGVAAHPLVKIWNEHRGPLPEVKASNNARDRKSSARWKENPDERYWTEIVKLIATSSFCIGQNERGWRATFDWLLQPETHLKVSEGKYNAQMYQGARDEFGTQMESFRANFGIDKFSDEKCALIWDELKQFSPKQIKSICIRIISENQFAPVLSHFMEKSAMLREKIRQWERDKERADAADFWDVNTGIEKPKAIE
jgi:hypothetical protein